MGRRPRASNETLIELFLDMIAAAQGDGTQTVIADIAVSSSTPPDGTAGLEAATR